MFCHAPENAIEAAFEKDIEGDAEIAAEDEGAQPSVRGAKRRSNPETFATNSRSWIASPTARNDETARPSGLTRCGPQARLMPRRMSPDCALPPSSDRARGRRADKALRRQGRGRARQDRSRL